MSQTFRCRSIATIVFTRCGRTLSTGSARVLERAVYKVGDPEMMERSGLENISFSETSFWTAVGNKKA